MSKVEGAMPEMLGEKLLIWAQLMEGKIAQGKKPAEKTAATPSELPVFMADSYDDVCSEDQSCIYKPQMQVKQAGVIGDFFKKHHDAINYGLLGVAGAVASTVIGMIIYTQSKEIKKFEIIFRRAQEEDSFKLNLFFELGVPEKTLYKILDAFCGLAERADVLDEIQKAILKKAEQNKAQDKPRTDAELSAAMEAKEVILFTEEETKGIQAELKAQKPQSVSEVKIFPESKNAMLFTEAQAAEIHELLKAKKVAEAVVGIGAPEGAVEGAAAGKAGQGALPKGIVETIEKAAKAATEAKEAEKPKK